MDFYTIKERSTKNGVIEVYPDFKVGRSQDLMVRGKAFYAIWDDERGLWSTDEYDVQRLVDQKLLEHRKKIAARTDGVVYIKSMRDFSSNSWFSFRSYLRNISDNAHQLDETITFSNTEVRKKDYVSKRLDYPLEEGSIEAYDELIGTLYNPDERAKLEWAIGAVVSGDSKYIQKFIVLYGEAGSGKSTFLNIVQKLFRGYCTTFDAKDLTSTSNAFATEVFKDNPLVAIQHDGDLSRIDDNTKLNSIVSHELMTMNEKYKASYTARVNSFLFMATNKPVKITDAKSGIIRRLIDVRPSGRKVDPLRYQALMQQIDFELGAIANHCLEIYRSMGKNYYMTYRPIDMMFQTDVFFNFVEEFFHTFREEDGVTLKRAYTLYKEYCDESAMDYRLPMYKFREELKNYFENFSEMTRVDGKQTRSWYSGFLVDKFKLIHQGTYDDIHQTPLVLEYETSLFDEMYPDRPAQYASSAGTPLQKWDTIVTKLSDLKTDRLHYVQPPKQHIVIDFDLVDENGNKDHELNLREASKWPPTYAEFSKSGEGLHLHYIYDGDVSKLSRLYSDGIEVKVFTGNSSLRRKFTRANNIPVATINSGLPLKGEKVLNFEVVKSEKALRRLIIRNLNKEIHPGTKPSVDFIHKILEDAYASELNYDITDMRPAVLAFAMNSTNHSAYCVKLVSEMQFKSEESSAPGVDYDDESLVFYDVEVFPNLFVVVWKTEGENVKPVHLINPTPLEIEELLKRKLIGYNCRRYDNHILYARYLGYSNEELFRLSKRLISNSPNATFGEAYSISYTDVYDFISEKKSLKRWEIDLGIHHQELGLPWDEPVDPELWEKVADYCENDVRATEAVFNARIQDFKARQILAELSGLTVNDTTQRHTAQIIFGSDRKAYEKFIYTDLSEMFPGYTFDNGTSVYRDEVVGEGGYVYAEPGMYTNVALLDIASMHPTSLVNMNMFGPYTKNFSELLSARLAIKHKEYEKAGQMLGGVLEKYLTDDAGASALSYALKIIINIVYGLTSAKFDNPFKDPRNIDNIVAKRGALFMIDLKHAVQEQGYVVAHIKTDSIKIPNADENIVNFIINFGKDYGYTFEYEAIFEKFCLVNDAVYVGKIKTEDKSIKWSAVGAQFIHPFVYKTLFSKEPIIFTDLIEVKAVSSDAALYLDLDEELGEEEHDYHFVGRTGAFCPILPGRGGGILLRKNNKGQYHAVSGSKGYRWLEAELVKLNGKEDDIDLGYYRTLIDKAAEKISQYGDFEWFVDDSDTGEESLQEPPKDEIESLPWLD